MWCRSLPRQARHLGSVDCVLRIRQSRVWAVAVRTACITLTAMRPWYGRSGSAGLSSGGSGRARGSANVHGVGFLQKL